MTDRELLELAANAAGLIIVDEDDDLTLYVISQHDKKNGDEYGERWAPLEDDGDALRLAVRLDISVNCNTARGTSWTHDQRGNLTAEVLHDDAVSFDPLAATRRAIVRAAAEIGRTMQ